MSAKLTGLLGFLNEHPLTSAMAMLILNIGGKYVDFGLTDVQEAWIGRFVTREIFILAVVFVATKDLLTSVLVTLVVTILMCYLLNDRSYLCLLSTTNTKYKNNIGLLL